MDTLKDRIITYEEIADTKLPRRLPIITVLNGRRFRKTTSLLEKPFDEQFVKILGETLISLASEIDGAIFLYSFNDEIIIISKNDQNPETEPWYNNHIQKIVSATSSLASISLYNSAQNHEIKLLGNPIFTAKSFIIPNLTEAVNYLIYKQNQASQTAISMACFYELLKQYDIGIVNNKLKNKNADEKLDILFKECDIELQSYNLSYWRGIAVYRENKIIYTEIGKEVKKKLIVNTKLPFFSKDQTFLYNILKGT